MILVHRERRLGVLANFVEGNVDRLGSPGTCPQGYISLLCLTKIDKIWKENMEIHKKRQKINKII